MLSCEVYVRCFALCCTCPSGIQCMTIQNKHTVAVQKPDADMIWTRQAAKVLLQAGASAFARNCSGPMPQCEHIMSSGTPCELLRQTPRFPKGKNTHSNDIIILYIIIYRYTCWICYQIEFGVEFMFKPKPTQLVVVM